MRKKGESIMRMFKILLSALFCLIFIAGCSSDSDSFKPIPEPPRTPSFMVVFDSHGGSWQNSVMREENSVITLPTPTRSGFTFSGWFSAATGGTKFGDGGSPYTVTRDVIMHAQWTNHPTVTFNSQGGSFHGVITQASGTIITLPATTRDGHWFLGWFSAASGGTKFGDGGDGYLIAGNVTMHAQWLFAIFFVTDDNVCADCPLPSVWYLPVRVGEVITLPRARSDSGGVFDGWYSAPTGGLRHGGAGDPFPVTTGLVMYARFTDG